MWFIRFLVLWFLISTGVDCVRGEDIMSLPTGYSDEVTPLGWAKVILAAILTIIVELALRSEKRKGN